MEFREVVQRRRMVRRYRADPVAPAVVTRIVDAAVRAPSAGWSQGVAFVVVTDGGRREAIANLCRERDYVGRGFDAWLSKAPVHIVLCVRPDDYRRRYAEADKNRSGGPGRWQVPFWWVDAGAALEALLLAAVDEGLGAGFLDVPNPETLRMLLDIPTDVEVVGLVTIGYEDPAPQQRTPRRARRPTREIVRRERWSTE
jgi:nitroreductase